MMEEQSLYLFIEPHDEPAFWVKSSEADSALDAVVSALRASQGRATMTITGHMLTPSEYEQLSGMDHIDDWCFVHTWIEDPEKAETIKKVKHWFREFRRPAVMLDMEYLDSKRLTCTYEGKRYRCIGASRMGDVWLTRDMNRTHGYDKRVMRSECSLWEIEDVK